MTDCTLSACAENRFPWPNGVVCELYLSKVKVSVARSCPTLCDLVDCSPPGSSVRGIFQVKDTGVGVYFRLHGIFLTQGSNPGLLHCRQVLHHLSHQEAQEVPQDGCCGDGRGLSSSPWLVHYGPQAGHLEERGLSLRVLAAGRLGVCGWGGMVSFWGPLPGP